MTSREHFLAAIEADENDKYIELMQQHASKKDCFDVEEILVELNKKQLEEVWTKLLIKVTSTLLSFADEEDSEELQVANTFLQSVLTLAHSTLSLSDVDYPSQLLETAVVFHGILLSLPDELDKLKNNIAKFCELWWQKDLERKEDLAPQTFMYLLQRSLSTTATGADVKRVHRLQQCVELMNLENESSSSMKNMLQHAFISINYLNLEEGKRFLTFLFSLNLNFIETIHKTVKNHIPSSANSILTAYGEIYFRAWKVASAQFLEKIEQYCIQDLMYHAVHARRGTARSLANALRKVLSYIHQQKMQRGVDEMLLRLYEPIMWRSLKVANADVRANAAALLVDAFPLQNPLSPNEENDAILQKQFDTLSTLMEDPSHMVRITAIQGICLVCKVFWELIPAQTIKVFILKLLQDLAWDSASADVRVAVLKGMTLLLDNQLSHPLLKNVLPEIKSLLHDTSEKVRIAFIEMLLRVKGMRAIKFWTLVPMEHLLARLELDSPPVGRRIVSLILNSYLPVDKPIDVQITRCIVLLQTNQGAARKFYQYAPKHLGLEPTVKIIAFLCKYVHGCVKESKSNTSKSANNSLPQVENDFLMSSDSESETDTPRHPSGADNKENTTSESQTTEENSQAATAGNNFDVSVDDFAMIAGLLETMLIMWMSLASDLDKGGNKEFKRKLQYRFSHVLPDLFRFYQDERILSSLIMLAGFLPPNAVPMVSRSMMSKIKAMDESSTVVDFGTMLESMCKWGKINDVLDLTNEWLEGTIATCGLDTSNLNKSRRKSKTKKVGFSEPCSPKPLLALEYMSYLTRHPVCRDILLGSERKGAHMITDTLSKIPKCLEKRFTTTEALSELVTDEFLVKAFEEYCKMMVLLHEQEHEDHNAITIFENLVTWADVEILRLLKKKKSQVRRKKLMRDADATLLSNPSGDETTLHQTIADHTALMSGTMSETLLNDTLLGTGMKRISGDGSQISQLASQILQALVSIASNMLLVGVGNQSLATHLADFAVMLLHLDESSQFLPLIAKLMYQITELTLSLDLATQDQSSQSTSGRSSNSNREVNIVPNMLTKVVHLLATLTKNKKEQAERVLPTIKPAFAEILTSYYRHHSMELESMSKDVISTIMAAVLAEMRSAIKKDHMFEECTSVASLPLLSAFLLGLVVKRAVFVSLFLAELTECIKSKADVTIEARLAALHIVNAIANEKRGVEVKECVLVLQSEVESNTVSDDILDDSPQRAMFTASQTLLKSCMTTAGMVS